jgi:hypothetical protein
MHVLTLRSIDRDTAWRPTEPDTDVSGFGEKLTAPQSVNIDGQDIYVEIDFTY